MPSLSLLVSSYDTWTRTISRHRYLSFQPFFFHFSIFPQEGLCYQELCRSELWCMNKTTLLHTSSPSRPFFFRFSIFAQVTRGKVKSLVNRLTGYFFLGSGLFFKDIFTKWAWISRSKRCQPSQTFLDDRVFNCAANFVIIVFIFVRL